MNELALFAGAGGGILGGKLLGWRTVCAVEFAPYARDVLLARQNDGHLEPFPIWDDVRTFDGRPWRGVVDVVSGGFPCQDISCANRDGDGLEGERSGLWSEMRRIVGEVGPQFVFVENTPMLTVRGIDRVLGDLAGMGFDAAWGVLGACHAGYDHRRERLWIVADHAGNRPQRRREGTEARQREAALGSMARLRKDEIRADIPAPDAFGNPVGLACRMERLKAVGNGQCPAVAALAWETLSMSMHNAEGQGCRASRHTLDPLVGSLNQKGGGR